MIKIIFLILLLIALTVFMVISYIDGFMTNHDMSGVVICWIILLFVTILAILRKSE